MTDISVVGPDGGEQMLTGPVRMRILEDGSTTGHRLGIGEITVAPHTEGPPQHRVQHRKAQDDDARDHNDDPRRRRSREHGRNGRKESNIEIEIELAAEQCRRRHVRARGWA